jgi:hypothetical protein
LGQTRRQTTSQPLPLYPGLTDIVRPAQLVRFGPTTDFGEDGSDVRFV